MKTKTEKKVHSVVEKLAKMGGSRNEVCRAASIKLNEKHGINVAASDAARSYLIDALDEHCGHGNNE
jgi:hypothetical protein